MCIGLSIKKENVCTSSLIITCFHPALYFTFGNDTKPKMYTQNVAHI